MSEHDPQTVADGRDMPTAIRAYLIGRYRELAEVANLIANPTERDYCLRQASALEYGGSLAALFREARDDAA